MALDLLNRSDLEQLALKGLTSTELTFEAAYFNAPIHSALNPAKMKSALQLRPSVGLPYEYVQFTFHYCTGFGKRAKLQRNISTTANTL